MQSLICVNQKRILFRIERMRVGFRKQGRWIIGIVWTWNGETSLSKNSPFSIVLLFFFTNRFQTDIIICASFHSSPHNISSPNCTTFVAVRIRGLNSFLYQYILSISNSSRSTFLFNLFWFTASIFVDARLCLHDFHYLITLILFVFRNFERVV